MKRLVIDASVVLKWYLTDEEYGQKALGLLEKYISNESDLLAPSLLEYEVVNGLTIAQKRGRIKEDKILLAIDGFMDLKINLKDLSQVYPKVLHYCRIYNCSVYDASYLAIADEEKIPVVTADKKLYDAVKKDLRWVRWLGDI